MPVDYCTRNGERSRRFKFEVNVGLSVEVEFYVSRACVPRDTNKTSTYGLSSNLASNIKRILANLLTSVILEIIRKFFGYFRGRIEVIELV